MVSILKELQLHFKLLLQLTNRFSILGNNENHNCLVNDCLNFKPPVNSVEVSMMPL